jgi:hypothetical protein
MDMHPKQVTQNTPPEDIPKRVEMFYEQLDPIYVKVIVEFTKWQVKLLSS